MGANPRNGLRLEGTFVAVEKLDTSGEGGSDRRKGKEEIWTTVRTDADWNLVFRWERTSTVWATSEVSVEWEIEDADTDADADGDKWAVQPGVYRMRYFGDAKAVGGGITAFEGVGDPFRVGIPGEEDGGLEGPVEAENEDETELEDETDNGNGRIDLGREG